MALTQYCPFAQYEQFSEALAEAAIRQQEDIRDVFESLATIVSDYANAANQTWPFVDLPKFEAHAKRALKIAGTEVCTFFPKVTKENSQAWFNYTNRNYKRTVKEAHMIDNGNLSDLHEDGYKPFFSVATEEGFIEDIDRDHYFPMWQFSPPMFTYGAINWNVISLPEFACVFQAVESLKYESLISEVRPYVTAGLSSSYEEHAAMHSEVDRSSTDFPHSFVFTPIHLDSEDPNSPLVGMLGSAIAWDFSLRNLLPDGVVGIIAVLDNSCSQKFTYEINGKYSPQKFHSPASLVAHARH